MPKNGRPRALHDYKDIVKAELEKNPDASFKGIAARYGMGESTTRRYALELGFGSRRAAAAAEHAKLQAKIAERHAADPNFHYADLAKELGVSSKIVAHWAKKLIGRRRRLSTPSDHARWAQMFERGTNLRRIAQITGFHAKTIADVLSARGLDTVRGTREVMEKAMAVAKEEGITYAEAARRVGVTPKSFTQYRHAIKKRKVVQNADADLPNVHDQQRRRLDQHHEAAGGGDARDAPLVGPHDLRTQEGRNDQGGLAGSDAFKGQAPRERLRRCG